MSSPNPLLVYGSTEFGRVIKDLGESCGYSFAGFIDDWYTGGEVVGTFASVCASHPPGACVVALAIGYKHMQARRQVANQVRDVGYEMPNLVHPEAFVAPSVRLGGGVIIMARACIDVRVHVGSLTVVWPGAIISHDCNLLGNTFVSPGATLCGHCQIGEDSFLGAGSIVVDHLALSKGTFLKAGEVFKGKPAPVQVESER